MIHNPSDRIAKMLVEIASYDPRAEVKRLPLSKAFKGLESGGQFISWNSRVIRLHGSFIPRWWLRHTGFAQWYIVSDRISETIGLGHTLERCAMQAVKRIRKQRKGHDAAPKTP